ncbi:pyocin knob domain-containing protein [Clostridium botulinum]|uniref:pyocin knob domain-containing protein n=1 Tax=Clostridium botulinum TaxID=1491 RepID=UPI0013FE5B20|nr:pyocin knob domain-containing protein [Clostridium botulinum]MBY6916064.1 hypothetical protein [Clostridium botulinum]NFQ39523.1 hypothetical protein [Clostridium botulinum]
MNIHELPTLKIDLKDNYVVEAVCKQLDDLILSFEIYNSYIPIDLSSFDIELRALKSDKVPVIQDADIVITNNKLKIKCNPQLTTSSGVVKAELECIDKITKEKKFSFDIEIEVKPSVLEVNRSISTPTCTLMERLEKDLDKVRDLEFNFNEADKINKELKDTTIPNANKINTTLEENTKKATTSNTNLKDSTNTANTAKQAVDSSVVQANLSKQALDTSKVNADNTKKEVDAAIIVADEKIEIIKNLDPENVVEDVKKLKEQVLENTYTKIETDSSLTKLDNCENGFVRNMQLKGKTLQNLWNGGNVNYLSSENRLIETTTLDLYKTNTNYTIINYNNKKIKLGIFTKANTYSRSIEVLPNSKFIIRLNDEIIKDKVGEEVNGWANSDNDKNELKKSIVILEGEVKEIPPYFEGIQSTGELEGNKISILTKGKNLFDNNINFEQGTIQSVNIGNVPSFTFANTRLTNFKNKLKIFPNKKYTLSSNLIIWVIITDKNGISTSGLIQSTSNIITFDSGTSGEYLSVILVKEDNLVLTPNDLEYIQLEENTTSTPYESYIEDKTEILTGAEPLRGLPSGVTDVVDYDKNERIKNVGKVVFDGSEAISYVTASTSVDTLLFSINNTFGIKGNEGEYSIVALSDKFYYKYNYFSDNNFESFFISKSGGIYIRILKSKLETQDVAGFKKWLQTNPTTVYYQLATQVVEKLNIKDTLQSFENGYIQLDNSITPTAQLEYSTNIPSAIGGLTKVVDKVVDDVTNVEITISDMDAEIGEARKDKNTLEERLEEDRTNILSKVEKNTNNIAKIDNFLKRPIIFHPDSTDLNTVTQTGLHRIMTAVNSPLGSAMDFMVDVFNPFEGNNSIIQMCYCLWEGADIIYERKFVNNKWSVRKIIPTDDTGWIDLPLIPPLVGYSDNVVPKYRKINNILEVRGAIKGLKTINSNTGLDFSTLPVGFRPKHTIGVVCQGSRLSQWYLTVSSSGVLNIDRYSEDGSTLKTEFNGLEWLPFQIMFSVD